MKCADCPLPPGRPCRGEAIPHKCGDPRYRDYFVRLDAEPELPSLGRQIAGFVSTGLDVLNGAMRGEPVTASPEEQQRRWGICKTCDHFRPSDQRCGGVEGCGCWLANSIPVAAKRCPIGRWEEGQGGSGDEGS